MGGAVLVPFDQNHLNQIASVFDSASPRQTDWLSGPRYRSLSHCRSAVALVRVRANVLVAYQGNVIRTTLTTFSTPPKGTGNDAGSRSLSVCIKVSEIAHLYTNASTCRGRIS